MFYGIDLAHEKFKGAVIGSTGDEIEIVSCSLGNVDFEKFKARLTQDDYVVVEATTNAFWFVQQIRELVKECYVVDPFKFSIIAQSTKKTDHIDAVKLARRLKYHILFDNSRDEFPSIFVPAREVQEIRSLFTTYETLKKEKNITKNRIRSLLTQNGFHGLQKKDLSYERNRSAICALQLNHCLRGQIEVLFGLLISQLAALDSIKTLILQKGVIFNKEITLLTSIRGISHFVAIAIMSDVVDINRFPNSKHFCSYLRATPSINASGNITRIGHINKHSRHLSMSLLAECINHFRRSSSRIDDFYVRKSKGKTKGKVRVAVIRKMLVIMFNMLSTNTLYHFRDAANHERKMKEYNQAIKIAA